ncbi:MAG: PilZ domain-containing protein [Candidatus Omnitrophota bacterium]|nr:MAG: PilZ domain-containing protein [Candidatus Omnitrophota bacterium]
MNEKRQFVRLDACVKIKWEKIVGEWDDSVGDVGTARNISGGGICLVMYERMVEAGDLLQIEIDLPTSRIVQLKGRVDWIDEFDIAGGKPEKRYDVGIEFLDIRDEDREDIKQFVIKSFAPKASRR